MRPLLHATLSATLSPHLDLGKSRLETLSWLIVGLLNARTVNLSHLASQCPGTAQLDSSYRRLQRVFQYVTLAGDWSALVVVKLLRLKGPWILCLDRTNWKVGRRDVNILMLAIATRRLRIPLMWTNLDRPGTSNQAERIALMRRYLALFGSGSIAWLLADREFVGARWMRFLLRNNILFAIRLKENYNIQFEDGRREQLKYLLRKPHGLKRLQSQPLRLDTMDESHGFPLKLAAKRLGDGTFLIIASNGPAKPALRAYRKRWQIECLFGDSKTRGFNIEDTRITQPDKLNTLLVIITLAMAWAYACATAIKGKASVKTRAHGYRYKSWFRVGFDQLRKWILHQPHRAAETWIRIWPKRSLDVYRHRVV